MTTQPKKIAIVGAGLAGATLAYELARMGHHGLTIFDQRDHVAGNAHTERDHTGVMVHKYGPHIFHTDNAVVWRFIQKFGEFMPHIQRTKALSGGEVYSFPINLHTINQYFGRAMDPAGAKRFIAERAAYVGQHNPTANFEDYAVSLVGPELYCAFLRDYTKKQWGMEPRLLPASILKRLPMRFDYNDNAFSHRFQGIPRDGYTALVARMIEVSRASLQLNEKFTPHDSLRFDHTFYSGPIDEWFGHKLGRLPYRTLDFETFRYRGDGQGCAVLNNCDLSTPWTRATEHKHFTPWEPNDLSVITREYSRDAGEHDIPYYPIRFADDKVALAQYQALARGVDHVTFMGRLGTYRYIDMDVTVAESLYLAKEFHDRHAERS